MLTLLEDEARREGIGRVILHAQESALALYRRAGYRDAGEPFLEAGIRHRPLVKDLQVG
jgi:predicted GNAT family N-acyltransferase